MSHGCPVLQQAFAHDVGPQPNVPKLTKCPDDFRGKRTLVGTHPDHNGNRNVCVKTVCHDGPQGKPPLCRVVATVDDIAIKLRPTR